MHAPPLLRLQRRRDLLELKELLKNASGKAAAASRAYDLIRAGALDLASALNPALARDLERDLDLAHALASALDRALDRALDLALDLDLVRAPARDLALAPALARVRDTARDLALDLVRVADRDLASGMGSGSHLEWVLGGAGNLLRAAADDFVGADLTAVNPSHIDLAGLRWNDKTRWPSREWADRIRRASVERPPGSGHFTVLPEENRRPAKVTSS
ncbi:hypothetical protein ACIQB5_49510 [Streptomyces sp. NPDC088560]|uniref:hypothetical protein n=1 Tax=Streptomyces sp. NPDC088560 TaxID=3365868 RepID=UPI00382DEC07